MVSFQDLSIEVVGFNVVSSYKGALYSDDVMPLKVVKLGVDSIKVSIGNGCFLEMFAITC
jgi:hypothetical protein